MLNPLSRFLFKLYITTCDSSKPMHHIMQSLMPHKTSQPHSHTACALHSHKQLKGCLVTATSNFFLRTLQAIGVILKCACNVRRRKSRKSIVLYSIFQHAFSTADEN